MEFFQVNLLGTGGAERVHAPLLFVCSPARLLPHPPPPLASGPSPCVHPPWSSPFPCVQPFPLCTPPLVPPPPLVCSPSPCTHPSWSLTLPLCVTLPLHASPSSLLCPWHACKGGRHVGRVGCINWGVGVWHSLAKGDWDGHAVPLALTSMRTKRACGHVNWGAGLA